MARLVVDGKFTPEVDILISESLTRWKVPGVSFAVIENDTIISKGYGISELPDKPVTSGTLFNCASMTKVFTAAAVSLLVDDDEQHTDVQWPASVSSLMREDFVLSDERTDQVTVEDILSHRTGFPDHDDACMGVHSTIQDTTRSTVRKFRYLPMNAPLRTKYQYSNLMYTAAAHLVETRTGQFLGDFFRNKIWEPLNMRNSYYGMKDLRQRRGTDQLAHAYRWDEKKEKYVDVEWADQMEGSGAGEMICSAPDYAKFIRCMIDKSEPLSEKGHEELTRPRMITDEEPKPFCSPSLYSLGLESQYYHGEQIIGHGGSVTGFNSTMVWLPRLRWGFVGFGNTGSSYSVLEKIQWALIDELLDISEDQRFDWDAHNEKEDEEEKEEGAEERRELYPILPTPTIPLSLPLEDYAGTYTHPGYGTLELKFRDGKLQADCMDRTWPFMLYLEHVSGEYFIADRCDFENEYYTAMRAQFRQASDGTVTEFGIELVPDVKGEIIWFEKANKQQEAKYE